MRRTLALALLIAVFGAACAKDPGPLPPPPSIPAPATTTTEADFSDVGLRAVPAGRRAAAAVPIGPGRATLTGSIIGPDGPVPDADVLVERIVNDGVGSMAIKAGPDGIWKLPNVLGGRYRIRAWRAPDLAMVKPTITFITASETRPIDLKLALYGGTAVKPAIAPNPPPVAEASTLVVLVTTRTVDQQGIVRATPVPGARVELVGTGAWRVESSNPTFSDSRGEAEWSLRCRQEGRQPLAVTVGEAETETFPLNLPDCVVPTTTTTEEFAEPTTPQTTTTTR